MLKRIVTDWWNRTYGDWVPEVALRYLPVVESLRADRGGASILEVGVNRSGLTTYLRKAVIGVDCVLDRACPALVTPVLARGQALPFRNRSFDYTVCMDTLEHVAPSERSDVLRELIRVTKRRVYVGCPMDAHAEHEDLVLQRYYRRQTGESFRFLDEHVRNGLPRLQTVLAEMERIARESGRSVRLQWEPNLNVWLHRLLLCLWIRTDRLSYVLHRLAVTLVHVRGWLNVGPCYRQIVTAELDG